MYMLGIDIGGTNTVVGVVDEYFNILSSVSFKTLAPRPAEELCKDIRKAAEEAAEKAGIAYSDIKSAGADSPGVISNGICEYANNLGFSDVPLQDLLCKALEMPAVLCNDGNAAAYGEYIAGCGKGKKSLAMLTIGTGIGGGFIVGFSGLCSWGATAAANTILLNSMRSHMELEIRHFNIIEFIPSLVVIDLILVVVLTVVSALAPIWAVHKIKPINIIKAKE